MQVSDTLREHGSTYRDSLVGEWEERVPCDLEKDSLLEVPLGVSSIHGLVVDFWDVA